MARRDDRPWGRMYLQVDDTLATLARFTVSGAVLGPTVTKAFTAMKIAFGGILWNARTADEGPLALFLTTQLSAGELEEALEMAPTNPQDINQLAQGPRWKNIQFLGMIGAMSPSQANETDPYLDLSGHSVKIVLEEGQQFALHAYNVGSGALTTGSQLEAALQLLGKWST